ncbi:hypothetical protein FK513_29160, partial [Klebsiella pneumoniae]|nr:hypothetical protein [Klebsiella pneumoniae]
EYKTGVFSQLDAALFCFMVVHTVKEEKMVKKTVRFGEQAAVPAIGLARLSPLPRCCWPSLSCRLARRGWWPKA